MPPARTPMRRRGPVPGYRSRNTIRAYRGHLAFAAHHDGEVAGLTAAPARAFLGEIAGRLRVAECGRQHGLSEHMDASAVAELGGRITFSAQARRLA